MSLIYVIHSATWYRLMLITGTVTESAISSPEGLTTMATNLKVGAISVETGTEKVNDLVGW